MEYYLKSETSYLGKIQFNNNELLSNCIKEIEGELIENPPIIIFGKPAIQHRDVGFFSNSYVEYYFARQFVSSKPLTPSLNILLNFINETFKSDFNAILINKYKDGNDYIGKHSDSENGLATAGVVCVSYGASRKFRIRNKQTNKIVIDIQTSENEILIMGGNFQKEFTHEIPIEKKIKSSRISFTFRKHIK